jgi:hypothetical protein
MSLTGEALEAAVRRLQREFGNQLDREVLESVLEICGGDVDQTVAFLRVQNDSTCPPFQNPSILPFLHRNIFSQLNQKFYFPFTICPNLHFCFYILLKFNK